MKKRILLGLTVLILIILVGCGDQKRLDQVVNGNVEEPAANGNDEANEKADEAEETETPEGYARFEMVHEGKDVILEQSISSPMELPIDFPFSLPNGDIVIRESDRYFWPDGNITYLVKYDVGLEFDEIVDFYGSALDVSQETYDPTNLAILSGDSFTIKIEDEYDPDSYTVIIETER